MQVRRSELRHYDPSRIVLPSYLRISTEKFPRHRAAMAITPFASSPRARTLATDPGTSSSACCHRARPYPAGRTSPEDAGSGPPVIPARPRNRKGGQFRASKHPNHERSVLRAHGPQQILAPSAPRLRPPRSEPSHHDGRRSHRAWSRSAIANYFAPQTISTDVWDIIVTTFVEGSVPRPDDGVTEIVTAVTFTENLLRSIVNLNGDQQLELVQDLAAGGATNGPVIGTTFESEAVAADVSTVPFPEGPLYPLPPCVGPSPSSALLTQASCPQPSPYEIGGWFSQRRENHRQISRPVRSPDQHRHVPGITMRSTRW